MKEHQKISKDDVGNIPPSITTEVAVQDTSTDVAKITDVNELLGSFAGAGSEHLNAGDKAIPYWDIVQKGTPILETNDAAKIGMIFNNGTGELVDGNTGIEVVLCAYDKKYVEWIPKDLGGGFVATYRFDPPPPELAACTPDPKNKRKLFTPEGNEFKETAYYFVGRIVDGDVSPGVVSMTSSKLKPSRSWNTMWDELKIPTKNGKVPAPIFAQRYRLTTKEETSKVGNFKYRNWVVTPLGIFGQNDMTIVRWAAKANADFEAGAITLGAPPRDDDQHSDADENTAY